MTLKRVYQQNCHYLPIVNLRFYLALMRNADPEACLLTKLSLFAGTLLLNTLPLFAGGEFEIPFSTDEKC